MYYDLGQQWKQIERSTPFQTLKKKKKSKNANTATYNSNPNTHYGSIWTELIVAETEN